MKSEDFRNKKITIMGLGINQGGLGVAMWLLKHGAYLTVTDLKDQHALVPSISELERSQIILSRKIGKGKIHRVEYILGKHRESDFRNVDMVIRNPAVPSGSRFLSIARKNKVPIESDVSLFFKMNPLPVIGVTGSKGKTTVTIMLGEMLKKEFGRAVVAGNMGKSPLDSLDGLLKSKKHIPVVLELSSWGLENLKSVKASPHYAVVTNVFVEHLDRYKGFKEYADSKSLIYRFQNENDTAVISYDQSVTRKMGQKVGGKRFWASMGSIPAGQNGMFFKGNSARIRVDGKEIVLFNKSQVKIRGEHNLWNALLAAGIAKLNGVSVKNIRSILGNFSGVPNRLELIRTVGGVEYWNDTSATNPDASIAAMKTLSKKKNIILLAGGADKKLQFGQWAKATKKYCREVILFDGTAKTKIMRAMNTAGKKPYSVVKTMTSAIHYAAQLSKKGDTVLLSPGAASFGVFVNEFDRGDKFKQAVKKLKK